MSGHGSGDFGIRNAQQLIDEYRTEEFELDRPLIMITVGRSYFEERRDLYDSVRGIWRISKKKAERYDLVLAQSRGIVLGAFRPTVWVEATRENFPRLPNDEPKRCGFIGERASPDVCARYENKRVPERFRARGAANPVRFVEFPAAPEE